MLVGQHQKNDSAKYIQTINFTSKGTTTIDNTLFYCYEIKDNNENTSFYYYVKIKFEKKQSDLQSIKIYAADTLEHKGIQVDDFTIGYKSSTSTTYYRDIIINSNLISNSLKTFYLKIKGAEGTLVQGVSIVNILPETIKTANSIGIWGSPSQIACVNGVKIQLGKTGIYELNNPNIKINFVGFIPIDKNFVLDYSYEELKQKE